MFLYHIYFRLFCSVGVKKVIQEMRVNFKSLEQKITLIKKNS
ncbi:hypothetical protein HZS_6485 [Henneguya salminicola]|nr:hypothetical protein HZS_6485 [Henneguya salminicola]